jgi:hypothetical protein
MTTILNDQTIIDNTHFEVDEKERLICYTVLPDGGRFAQAVSNKEAVQKNMIGWCNTVREFLRRKEKVEEEERLAKKERRQAEESPPQTTPLVTPVHTPGTGENAKELVLAHWEHLKDTRRNLRELIEENTAALEAVDKEMDELSPVIKAWKGVKGES